MRARLYFLILLAAAARIDTAGAVSTPDFSHYRIILDRRPFGEPPPSQVAEPAPRPEPILPPFTKSYRLCALTEKYGDVRVGFIDITARPPKTYFLWLGESEDGIRVVDVDFERSAALLEKDGKQLWLDMGGVPGTAGVATRLAGESGVSAASVDAKDVPFNKLSYSERLRIRREAMKKRQEERSQAREKALGEGEDAVKRLQEIQMDLIRARGALGPALPIPLTQEMDDQLVREGVLEPVNPE